MDYKLKHIPGFICVLFEIFYTEGIVSEETFWKWKDDDPTQDAHIISVFLLKEFSITERISFISFLVFSQVIIQWDIYRTPAFVILWSNIT